MTAAVPQPADDSSLLVVFDVNIWLDVARHLGAPFAWQGFNQAGARLAKDHVPHPTDPSLDSLRAVATTLSGAHCGRPLEVWSGSHIENMILTKLTQDTTAATDEDRGLGWGDIDANHFLDTFHDEVIARSNGSFVADDRRSYGSPPLDHEDGRVYRTAATAGRDEHGWYERFCVTRDREFRLAALPGPITVLTPSEWVAKIRRERATHGLLRMPPPATR